MDNIAHASGVLDLITKPQHPELANALAGLDFGTIMQLFATIMSFKEIKNKQSGEEGTIDFPDIIIRTSKTQRIILTAMEYRVE